MFALFRLILLTLTPFLELRAAIPYGIFQTSFSPFSVFLICVLTNFLLAPLVWFSLDKLFSLFLKIPLLNQLYQKTITRTQNKVKKYVDKYGVKGLALFIAIPLPGSGVYSGALGAYFLGFRFKDFLKASFFGVLVAGLLVTLFSLTGKTFFSFLLKT